MIAIQPLPTAVSELFVQATISGKITLADRYGLLAVLMDQSISDEDLHCINRMLYAVRKGRMQVVQELSSVL